MVMIIQKGDPVLRQVAEEVPLAEIGSPEVTKILADMRTALEAEEDGVALAAPQIGVPLRIFVVSPRVFAVDDEENEQETQTKNRPPSNTTSQPHVYINPTIEKTSRKKVRIEEGCLSVRWLYGYVRRAERTTVAAYGADGKRFTRGASGLLAQIFQHEVDHLDGVLFIDKATDIKNFPPEKIKRRDSKSRL